MVVGILRGLLMMKIIIDIDFVFVFICGRFVIFRCFFLVIEIMINKIVNLGRLIF